MMRGVVLWMGCAALLLGVASARADNQLSEDEFRSEMAENRALAAYVARNGMPDMAESRFLADRPPWDDHEVALFYLDRRLEISFARAFILGRPEVQITRYQRALTDAEVAALASRSKMQGDTRHAAAGPAERAEDAARRAEDAATRVEAAVAPVEHAAGRAEAAAGRMESSFHRALRK